MISTRPVVTPFTASIADWAVARSRSTCRAGPINCLASVGGQHATADPVEQRDAKFAFQAGDRLRQRRLRDVELLGGLAEPLVVDDREEELELPCIHSTLSSGAPKGVASTIVTASLHHSTLAQLSEHTTNNWHPPTAHPLIRVQQVAVRSASSDFVERIEQGTSNPQVAGWYVQPAETGDATVSVGGRRGCLRGGWPGTPTTSITDRRRKPGRRQNWFQLRNCASG